MSDMDNKILAAELCKEGITSGYAEVRRLIYGGAIKVNGEPATSWNEPVEVGDVITCGKHKSMVVK